MQISKLYDDFTFYFLPIAPVTGVQITIINSTAVLIQWNPAQLGDREEISTYSIHYRIVGGPVVIVNVRRSETAVTVRGLNPSERYAFQVTVTATINGELVDGEQAEAPLIIQLPSQSGKIILCQRAMECCFICNVINCIDITAANVNIVQNNDHDCCCCCVPLVPAALGCPFEYDIWNIRWGFTEPGTSAVQPCGRTLLG